ncbi:MAG: 30S ribosomal protein S6 [Candidatus Cloacimonadota bacterium]|nr:MAG: 30S ribosomal protein S6 [Candidatus Cloacimonadota bacterium]
MRDYESMIIISPDLSPDEIEKENNSILDFIKENGGEIENSEKWGKKTLAYEIKKKKEGYFFLNLFRMDTEKVNKLVSKYRINEKILRHNLIVK